ncbi:MAG TPA: hypothetical protein VFV78_11235 [Vicinamibacterales bacterium]|nr:hypothetical protein [Vicinamibacterales bacterium]
MSFRAIAGLAVSLVVVAAPGAARQESVQLVRKAKVGDVTRVQTVGKAQVDMNGAQMALDLKGIEKYTVTAVAANGDITETDSPESVELSMNGQSMPPDPEMMKASTIVIKPNRMLVSYTKEDGSSDASEGRMYHATTVIYPDTPVKVGDKWSKTFAANAATGARTARGDYQVLAFETVAGVATVKVSLTFQESVAPALKTKGTVWIERATGDVVKAEGTVEGFPLDETGAMLATVTLTQTRLPKGQ